MEQLNFNCFFICELLGQTPDILLNRP